MGHDAPVEVVEAFDTLLRYGKKAKMLDAVKWSQRITRRLEAELPEYGRRGTNGPP